MIGLISKANVDFCESLGCYHRVLTYEQFDQIARDTPCAFIDFAGNSALRMRTHSQFANLKYSCSVGGTHVDPPGNNIGKKGAEKDMPDVRATLFFAPAQKKRSADWGCCWFAKRPERGLAGSYYASHAATRALAGGAVAMWQRQF